MASIKQLWLTRQWIAVAALVLVPRQEARPLVALYLWGTALCLLNMMIGVGGGSFASSQVIPLLTLPRLSDFLTASFDTIGMLMAFMLCGVFIYALTVYLNWQRQDRAASIPSVVLTETT